MLAAGEEVWGALRRLMEEGTAPAPDEAMYAAGALCSLLQGRAALLCNSIITKVNAGLADARCALSTLLLPRPRITVTVCHSALCGAI